MIEPMLAETAKEIPKANGGHLFQVKVDGNRACLYLDSTTKIINRYGKDVTRNFPELANLHKQARQPMVIDGEIKGKSFKLTQSRTQLSTPFKVEMAVKTNPCRFHAFDCLVLDGREVWREMQTARNEMLFENWVDSEAGFKLPYFDDGVKLFEEVMKEGGEGIMAKLKVASYTPGKRSSAWLKVKNFVEEADLWIIAVTRGGGRREGTFGSCLLARLVDGRLKYVGNAGSGLNDQELLWLDKRLGKEIKEGEKRVEGEDIKFWLAQPVRVGDLGFEIRHTLTGVEGDDKLRFPTFRRKR